MRRVNRRFLFPPLPSLFFLEIKTRKRAKNDLNSNEAEMRGVAWKNWNTKGEGRGGKKKSTTAHLRPNMIYDLAGELHVMIERVDQGFVRSRKIAARRRIDSDADRLPHNLPPPRAFCHSIPRLRASARHYITPESQGRSRRRARGIHSA